LQYRFGMVIPRLAVQLTDEIFYNVQVNVEVRNVWDSDSDRVFFVDLDDGVLFFQLH
jgi:hypothetical protein